LKTLAESGFSAAVFGPGWTHEHFPVSSANGKSIAQSVERSVWEGTLLPDELDCDCRKGRPHHTQDYEMNPVVKFAREFPVGSPSFFYTNFRGAFELSANPEDAKFQPRPGSQAVLPHLLPFPAPPNMFVYAELPVKASQGLMIKVKLPSVPKEDALVVSKLNRPPGEVLRLCLYKLNMPANASLDATFDFTAMPTRGQSTIGFYTAYKMPMASTIEFQDSIIWYPYPGKTEHKTVEIKSEIAGSRLVELGVFCAGHNGMVKHDKLFRVSSVTVKPKLQPDVSWSIGSVQVLKREHVEGVQRRLVWTWNGSNDSRPNGSPWSRVTGPFSHFVVVFGGEEFGEVYCHEFPLQNSDFDMCEAEGDMEAVIRGILFDGGEVSSLPVIIKKCQAINV